MLDGCRLIELPRIADHRGNLSFVEGHRHVPFEIRRVYYLYDVPAGAARGGHAHRELEQVLIAVSGSFDVLLDDGRRSETVSLNRPFVGLYMSNMIWRELLNFSSGSVCLVLASEPFEEADYIREHAEFVRMATG
jgi:dTDP-4-dehydrorhamnose 3,5-epimerase-like enzyme